VLLFFAMSCTAYFRLTSAPGDSVANVSSQRVSSKSRSGLCSSSPLTKGYSSWPLPPKALMKNQ